MDRMRADVGAPDPSGVTDGDAFDEALEAAIAALPEPYRRELASVAIVVEEEPTAELLASVGARGLLGLYQGVPRTAYGADGAPVANKITLFRGPLMRAYPSRSSLVRGVRETFDHEVAHHLGISDARLRELRSAGQG
jgi:predicted Zn-dependent protease with MMP-like domain